MLWHQKKRSNSWEPEKGGVTEPTKKKLKQNFHGWTGENVWGKMSCTSIISDLCNRFGKRKYKASEVMLMPYVMIRKAHAKPTLAVSPFFIFFWNFFFKFSSALPSPHLVVRPLILNHIQFNHLSFSSLNLVTSKL